MKGKKTVIFILFSQLIFLSAITQTNELKFNLVLGPEGKPFGHIRCICQDPQGYMWFAAEIGKCLYRYDGNRFIVFRHDDNNPNTLGGQAINSVSADKNGMIWIGMDNGLDQYNPATGIFKHFRNSSKDPGSLAGGTSFAPVIKDKQGRIWVGTHKGLDQLDEKTGKFIHYRNEPGNPKSLSSNIVWNIYEDHEGVIWVATGFPFFNENPDDGGLNRLNADGSFIRYKHDPDDPHSLINNKVGAMYEDSRGVFWVGTGGDGLHTMDRKTGRFERHLYDPDKPDQMSRPPLKPNEVNDKINFITEDSSGAIWIGTEYSGLNRYDAITKKITHYENSNGFPARSGWHAITSRDGELWIATEEDKLFRVDPSHRSIQNIPVSSTATIFMEDTEGNVWVCTTGDGLLKYDQQLQLKQQFKNIPSDSSSIPDNFVISIFQQNANTFLVGMGSSVRILNNDAHKFTRFNSDGHLNDTTGKGFPNIFKDKQGIFWFCRWGSGLVSYNPKDNSYRHFLNSAEDSTSLGSNFVLNAIEDRSGEIWAGGFNGGVNRLHRETGKFKHYLPGKSFANLFEANNGTIWASGNDGLFQYNQQEDKFDGFFDPLSELNSFKMNSIAEDDAKNLWINSGSALIKINPSTKETFIYRSRFGIDSASLSYGGIYKTRKGQILAGNNKGFYIFYPNELDVKTKFTINITGLFINSSHTNYKKGDKQDKAVEEISELDLNYNQNNISFDFAAIDYRNPEAIRYFFMLEEYDREWQEVKVKKENSSSYFNLLPGTYIYRVKAFNDEGTKAEKVITIHIHPPWWKTWWAYTIYFLVMLFNVFAIYRDHKKRIIRKERLKAQQFELAQAKEIEKAYHELRSTQAQLIHAEKMASLGELTAGIAHEIQNPLNFVNNFSEVNIELGAELKAELNKINISSEEKTNLLAYVDNFMNNQAKINEHGHRADAIVKSMLQHSRTSSGQKEPSDINALADEYLRLAYHGLRAKDKSFNAALQTDFDPVIEKVNIISQDIGRVLLNLYNNAFYAVMEKKKQHPEIFAPTVSVSTKKLENKILISVKDNGNGIPQNVLDKIFQPFFTTKPTGQGTGLGLSLSYDIVKAHGGELKVETIEGEGTALIIELPLK